MLALQRICDLLVCPTCRAELRPLGSELTCALGHRFPVVHGVPDLRRGDPPYHSRAEELDVVEQIHARGEHERYADLASWYYTAQASADYTERADVGVRWALGMLQRARTFLAEADEFLSAAGAAPRRGVALEIGCGGGGALEALAQGHERVLGLNVSLAELMLARRYLAEHDLHNVALVAASGEDLPLRSDSVGFALMEDVIEHVTDPSQVLQACLRALTPGGTLAFNSPNRYALTTPEGHVKLMWVGFLPRRLADPYVRLRTGRPYRSVRLLGRGELVRLLDGLGAGTRCTLFTPRLRPAGPSLRGRLYRHLARRLPTLADRIYLGLQPEFKVLVEKL